MLYFLNKLDFVGFSESDEYEKFLCIKKVLPDEFQDFDSDKILNMLGVVHDLHILFKTQDFQGVQILVKILRGDIFLLVKEKMIVE